MDDKDWVNSVFDLGRNGNDQDWLSISSPHYVVRGEDNNCSGEYLIGNVRVCLSLFSLALYIVRLCYYLHSYSSAAIYIFLHLSTNWPKHAH